MCIRARAHLSTQCICMPNLISKAFHFAFASSFSQLLLPYSWASLELNFFAHMQARFLLFFRLLCALWFSCACIFLFVMCARDAYGYSCRSDRDIDRTLFAYLYICA